MRFRSHGPGDPTHAHVKAGPGIFPPGTKALLFEHSSGAPIEYDATSKDRPFRRFSAEHPLNQYVREGYSVLIGEHSGNRIERFRLKRLFDRHCKLEQALYYRPTFKGFRSFFQVYFKWDRLRHVLIRRTIKGIENDLPVYGEYGGIHSTLAKELRDEGVLFKSKPAASINSYFMESHRRNLLSKDRNPLNKMSSLAMKRAYLDWIFAAYTLPLLGRVDQNRITLCAIFSRALLENLNEKQADVLIDAIEHRRPRFMKYSMERQLEIKKDFRRKLYEMNGLPVNARAKDLVDFARRANPMVYGRFIRRPQMVETLKQLGLAA